MGPRTPNPPANVDVAPDGLPRPQPRRWQYPISWNMPSPPGTEGIRLAAFQTLRAYADMSTFLRACIDKRIEEIVGMEWDIVPTAEAEKSMHGDQAAQKDFQDRRLKMMRFWARPDPEFDTFHSWLKACLEEVFVIDALSIYIAPPRVPGKGLFGTDLAALALIDGSCYSADTEVLTRKGWQNFADVDIATDEFATRNQITHEFQWQQAFYKHAQAFAGNMVSFKSRTLDVLVTPNHRMLATRNGQERIIRADELAAESYANTIPATSSWTGTEIPDVVFTANGKTNCKEFISTGDQFAAFMGMWLSEGSCGKNGNSDQVFISQQIRSKGYEPFRQLLTEIFGTEPCYTGYNWVIGRRVLADYLQQFGHALDKFVPNTILNSTPRQLKIFWDYYLLGDGYRDGNREGITTSSRAMANHLQEIAQKMGLSASISTNLPSGPVWIGDRLIKSDNPKFVVRLRTTTQQLFTASKVPYSNMVYCVSVPNETLYVRRNDQPFWAGNTIKPLLDLQGGRPQPPAVAFQQYIWGVARTDLSDIINEADVDEDTDYKPKDLRGDQLLYLPYHRRSMSPYGMSHVEACLVPIAIELSKQKYALSYYCHSDDTEILTDQGWKLFTDLDKTEKVATMTAAREFEWQSPTAYTDEAYSGEMVKFHNKSVDMLVTPNHRMLVKRSEYNPSHPNYQVAECNWRTVSADYFLRHPTSKFELPTTSTWIGADQGITAEFAHFVGLYLSEGWTGGDAHHANEINIAQFQTSKWFDHISESLGDTDLNWTYTVSNQRFRTANDDLSGWLKGFGHRAWNKSVPQVIKDSPPDVIAACLDGMFIGDGTLVNDKQRRWITTSKQLADDIQEMLQKCGIEGWIKVHQPQSEIYSYGIGKRVYYTVNERQRSTHHVPVAESVSYDSRVYCVTVPNHIILTRRNGLLAWAGNTEGNVPSSWITIGNADTPQQVRQWQDALDATIGDVGARHQVTVLPEGSAAHETKPNAFSDSYDMANKEEILAVFGLTAMEMGMLPGGKSGGLGGKGMADANQTQTARAATKPLLMFLKRNLFDLIMRQFAGQNDMEWHWTGLESPVDIEKQIKEMTSLTAGGLKSIDEGRGELGLQPWGLPMTAYPMVLTATGPISLASPTADQSIIPAPIVDPGGDSNDIGNNLVPEDESESAPTPPPTPAQVPGGPVVPGAPESSNTNVEPTPLHDAGPKPSALQHPKPHMANPTHKAVISELGKLRGYLRHGKSIDYFTFNDTPSPVMAVVFEHLNLGDSPSRAIDAGIQYSAMLAQEALPDEVY